MEREWTKKQWQAHSKRMKAYWADSDNRRMQSARKRAWWADPDSRQVQSPAEKAAAAARKAAQAKPVAARKAELEITRAVRAAVRKAYS